MSFLVPPGVFPVTLMSFLVAAGDYPELLVVTLMSFLVAAGDYPDVFPGGCW